MTELLQTSQLGLGAPRVGKVREVFDLGEEVLIVTTDRISAFDVVMKNGVPGKGKVLSQLSAFWFNRLSSVCPNHVVTSSDDEISNRIGASNPQLKGRSMIAKKALTVPVECVVRGYLAGSLYKEYKKEGSEVLGLNLPNGLRNCEKLSEPIFTPATKAEEGHDENISFSQMSHRLGAEVATKLRDWSLQLYMLAAKHAESCGVILADTKFEFGETDNGLIWIDEALTPDSSRYWQKEFYESGSNPPSFDKQFVRDYLESCGWDKNPPGPTLPQDVVEKTREKYIQAFKLLTGNDPAI